MTKHGHLNIIKYLVFNHNVDINCENSEFLTPLDVATIHGHLDIAEYLTETCGANIIRSRDTMKLLQQARLSKHTNYKYDTFYGMEWRWKIIKRC